MGWYPEAAAGLHRAGGSHAFSVLRSKRAVRVNIEIMRAFVRLRRMLQANTVLARQLRDLEKKYDSQFKVVFDAIRQLMTTPVKKPPKIGFKVQI